MRVSRTWRDLTNRKRAGFGHDTQNDPGKGELAVFCPACPQPGINLPKDWAERYDGSVYLYALSSSADYKIVILSHCTMWWMGTLLLNI
jgi:hypothetical protein